MYSYLLNVEHGILLIFFASILLDCSMSGGFYLWACALATPQPILLLLLFWIFALQFSMKNIFVAGEWARAKRVPCESVCVCVTSLFKSFVCYYYHSQFPVFSFSSFSFYCAGLSFSIHAFAASHTCVCETRHTLLRR